MALHLTGDNDWKRVVGGFVEEHVDKFEGLDATDAHSQLEHTALHEEYQVGGIEGGGRRGMRGEGSGGFG